MADAALDHDPLLARTSPPTCDPNPHLACGCRFTKLAPFGLLKEKNRSNIRHASVQKIKVY